MLRLMFVLIGLGVMLVMWGSQEFIVSQGAGSDPIVVELVELDLGQIPDTNYLRIGEHVAAYGGAVYEYTPSDPSTFQPNDSDKILECFYPIFRREHPFIESLTRLEAKYGGIDRIPDSAFPEVPGFTVLVKTKQFDTVGDIPAGIEYQSSLEGLVINSIESLDHEERALILSSFPEAHLDNVLIIEAGRTPAPLYKSVGMMMGGLLVGLLGVGFYTGSRLVA